MVTQSIPPLPPCLPPSLQTYEETLLDLFAYSQAQNISYGSLQVDSWWYFKVWGEGGREGGREGGKSGKVREGRCHSRSLFLLLGREERTHD